MDHKNPLRALEDNSIFQEPVKPRVKGFAPPSVDVKQIRTDLHLSQESFAKLFGFPLGTVRNWEQGTREPHGPARILLILIARYPEDIAQKIQLIKK